MSIENRIYIWLIVIMIMAAGFRYYKYLEIMNKSEDYLQQKDSLFFALKLKADSVFASLDSATYTHTSEVYLPSPININKATEEELTILPGIGPKMAKRIIDHRKNTGFFSTVDRLMDVKGIGEKKLEKMRKWVVVE